MKILGIETSCDDTAIALINGEENIITSIKEVASSQIDIHKIYGGVVPEVAARAHTESIIPLLQELYDPTNPPDAIAVTSGPGLVTSLIVGVETAKTIATLTNIPLISVNHMEGHIYSNWIDNTTPPEFPVLALIVSGGHTELILMTDHLTYHKIGWTVDDAAGECFDKVGKILGFEYPGGPKISQCAQEGNPIAISLPRPMINSGDLQFSFSGLKTAAKLYIEKNPKVLNNEANKADFCASFEQAIVDTLVTKTMHAIQLHAPKTVILGGGVSANPSLRTQLQSAVENTDTAFVAPNLAYTTDNASMIATVGYFKATQKKFTKPHTLNANPAWELKEKK